MTSFFAVSLVAGLILVFVALLTRVSPMMRRVGVAAAGVGLAGLAASYAGLGPVISIGAALVGAAALVWWAETTARS